MAGRPVSAGQESSSDSSVGKLLIGLNQLTPLPEQWTLPQEWNIEKRETFNFWKMDVQNQISNIATNLEQSLSDFPHPEISQRMDCQTSQTHAELEREKRLRSVQATNTLTYGLARKTQPNMM